MILSGNFSTPIGVVEAIQATRNSAIASLVARGMSPERARAKVLGLPMPPPAEPPAPPPPKPKLVAAIKEAVWPTFLMAVEENAAGYSVFRVGPPIGATSRPSRSLLAGPFSTEVAAWKYVARVERTREQRQQRVEKGPVEGPQPPSMTAEAIRKRAQWAAMRDTRTRAALAANAATYAAICEIQRTGVVKMGRIAEALEARGIRTPSGLDRWAPVGVKRIIEAFTRAEGTP